VSAAHITFLLQSSPSNLGGVQWLIVAGGSLLIMYVLMRPKKRKDPLIPSSPRLSIAQQKAVERQMESLLVEFSKMAQQMSAQLDTRSAKLELLLKEADEKLAALRAANAGHGRPAAIVPPASANGEPEAASEPHPPEPSPRVESRYAEVYGLADEGRSPQEIARQLGRPSGEVELILALRPKA
jgi:DNA-binding NarL/FixJ family response regulator